jgi:colicin import membrane protein
MPEQRENSVLFSLKELRRLEDDRIRQEEAEVRAQAEAERKGREDAERRAREDVERRRRDEEDRVRRVEDEQVARTREEQMRLQEAERRARVEAEMRLQEERMRLEMQHKKKHSPVKAVLTVAGLLVVIGGGVGYKMYSQHQAELATERAERARIEAQARKERAELEAKLVGIEKNMNDQLARAKTEEDRQKIRIAAAEAKAAVQGRPVRHVAPAKTEEKATTLPKVKGKREISDNPLDGF